MNPETRYDDTLEEMWHIKREIGAEYPTLEAYFKGFMDEQEARKRQGVEFVKFPPRRPLARRENAVV